MIDKRRKHKIINTIVIMCLLFLCLLGSYYAIFYHSYAQELLLKNAKNDSLLKNVKYRDSLYTSKTKSYSNIIEKYVSGCSFRINNKPLTTEEFVHLFNKTEKNNSLLHDSIAILKRLNELYIIKCHDKSDSNNVKGYLLNHLRENYGINYRNVSKTGEPNFVRDMSIIDTALALYPFYKDKIQYNTKGKSWTITTEKEVITTKRVPKDDIKKFHLFDIFNKSPK